MYIKWACNQPFEAGGADKHSRFHQDVEYTHVANNTIPGYNSSIAV